MKKKDIVKKISRKLRGTKIHESDVNQIIDKLISEIINSVSNGEPVYIRGFGRFYPTLRKGRRTNNPVTKGERFGIDEIIPKFKPYPYFFSRVKDGSNTK